MQLLLRHGAIVAINEVGGSNKLAPLHLASMNGHEAAVQLLIENGCDVNIIDNVIFLN